MWITLHMYVHDCLPAACAVQHGLPSLDTDRSENRNKRRIFRNVLYARPSRLALVYVM
jgi:hypothetical protein